jgi:uncharacterized DUF497 family protein
VLRSLGPLGVVQATAAVSVYTEQCSNGTIKSAANVRKHGVSFEEAATVFADPDALDGPDLKHSHREQRFLRLGRSLTSRMVIVAYTLRESGDDEEIRIISARRASRKERTAYRSGTPP